MSEQTAVTDAASKNSTLPMLFGLGAVLYFLRSSSKQSSDQVSDESASASGSPLYMLAALIAYCYRDTLTMHQTLQTLLPLVASNAALAYGRTHLTASIVALVAFLLISNPTIY